MTTEAAIQPVGTGENGTRFTFETDGGSFTAEFLAGFLGAFTPITISRTRTRAALVPAAG